jgi:hypothetical protein
MDRDEIKKHLALAEGHVAESRARLDQQRELVKELERDRYTTDQARVLLDQFEKVLKIQIKDRDRIQAERHRVSGVSR